MTRGFLLGKFLPPHNGHVFLCDFARAYVDHLTVLVCWLEGDPIPGPLRYAWMRELLPDCRVIGLGEDVPQDPQDHPDFWDIWRRIVRRAHPEPIDVVFASETYGHRLAAEVAARFVPVDPGRLAVPVSGRRVLETPFAVWEHLPPPVRAHFAKTVCVFGPESTGKSNLAARLARRFRTVLVPEYGRVHTDAFGTVCTPTDLERIVRGHRAATAAARRQANRLLILDTDPLLTVVWSQMLLGERHAWLADGTDPADLYLLTGVDVPWVDDGTRYFSDTDRRAQFHELCREELVRRSLPYVEIKGDWENRFHGAVAAILETFPQVA